MGRNTTFVQQIKDFPTRHSFGTLQDQMDQIEERLSEISARVPISRGTVFPVAPMYPSFFVHNRQSVPGGDRLYVSMQKSTGVWVWVHTGITAT